VKVGVIVFPGSNCDRDMYHVLRDVFKINTEYFWHEKNTEIFYKGVKVGIHRLDFILEEKLVVELKAQAYISPSHEGQTRSYLKTLKLTNGIIVNFSYPDKPKPDFKEIELR